MALLHRAEIRPTKLELLATWLPRRRWFAGEADAAVTRVAAYRFDDPEGRVGIETLLVRAGSGPILQVPLTYRGAPLDGAQSWLVGTFEHSVLGRRWVYDACGDPVYAAALAGAILADTGQAEEYFESDGRREHRAPSMGIAADGGRALAGGGLAADGGPGLDVGGIGAVERVADGDPTRIRTGAVELAVLRLLGGDTAPGGARLTGTWKGQPTPLPLAYATPR
ncbi:CG0192-related protein [Micromonospora sp. DT233]|uniref:CG0192-related protein n=1 Tax=Micromonospora sp. DT233 TaxID=3393432 RepID=UPI003CF4158D